MRQTTFLLVVALVLDAQSAGQGQFVEPEFPGAERNALTLEIEPYAERYCGAGAEMGVLQIDVRLRFKNSSKEILILHKGIGALLRMRIARTTEELEAGRYLYERSLRGFYSEKTATLRQLHHPSPEEFALLRPGVSFEQEELIPVVYDLSQRPRDALPPGRYFLRADVETWMEPIDLGIVLHKRWKKWGNLWYRPSIPSEPLQITIVDNPKAEKCD